MNTSSAPSQARQSAGQVCQRLHRAYRGFRLYPSTHPTARQTLHELVEALTSHLDALGALNLEVQETGLLHEGEEVYSHPESRDNLAFLMFRDGIRSLTFSPGIDTEEVEILVDSLAHADQLLDVEHDLATVFWESELHHIDYEAVDPFLEGEGVGDEALKNLRETVVHRLNDLTNATIISLGGGGEGGDTGPGSLDGGGDTVEDWGLGDLETPDLTRLDAESVMLTQADIEQCERAVRESSAALEDFAVVLLEIIGHSVESPSGDGALERSLVMLVQQYIDSRNLDGLAQVVDRLRSLEAEGRVADGASCQLFEKAMTIPRLNGLIASASQATQDEAARIDELLGRCRTWIFPSLLEILAESDDKAARRTVLGLLHMEDGIPARYLWPLMSDPRWYVVRNAVQLATGSGDPEFVDHLERLLRHPDERVRREVVRSLDTVGGSRSTPLLLRALNDQDSSVRILAARGLRRHGSRGHAEAVLARVESRDFDHLQSEEAEALLLAYGTLGGETAVETLNKMWKRRVFGTRSLAIRLAAVQALGVIGSSGAEEALAEAAKSGDTQIQRTATRALAEARAREGRSDS